MLQLIERETGYFILDYDDLVEEKIDLAEYDDLRGIFGDSLIKSSLLFLSSHGTRVLDPKCPYFKLITRGNNDLIIRLSSDRNILLSADYAITHNQPKVILDRDRVYLKCMPISLLFASFEDIGESSYLTFHFKLDYTVDFTLICDNDFCIYSITCMSKRYSARVCYMSDREVYLL